jgi:hypothetical protein
MWRSSKLSLCTTELEAGGGQVRAALPIGHLHPGAFHHYTYSSSHIPIGTSLASSFAVHSYSLLLGSVVCVYVQDRPKLHWFL